MNDLSIAAEITELDPHDNPMAVEWHQDCLVLTTLLACSLSEREMKRLLKRAGHAWATRQERAEVVLAGMHEACHRDQGLQALVAKELNAKFRNAVHTSSGFTASQVQEAIDEKPWPVPLIWACFQHQCPKVRGVGRLAIHLAVLRGARRLRGESGINQERERAESLARQNQALSQRLNEAQRERARVEERVTRLESRPAPRTGALEAKAKSYQKDLTKLKSRIEEQKQIQKELHAKIARWRSLALNEERKNSSRPCYSSGVCGNARACEPQPCASLTQSPEQAAQSICPLSGRKVAVIGGLDRLEGDYRQIIEGMGGECLCHDGHLRSGSQGLKRIVAKSDVVVYITSINSHGAMKVVKKHCKRCRKPFCPLQGAGVSALENLLRGMEN